MPVVDSVPRENAAVHFQLFELSPAGAANPRHRPGRGIPPALFAVAGGSRSVATLPTRSGGRWEAHRRGEKLRTASDREHPDAEGTHADANRGTLVLWILGQVVETTPAFPRRVHANQGCKAADRNHGSNDLRLA